MQEVTYATKTFVTTDALADALLRLVTSIRRDTHSEAVTVPAYTPEGRRVEAKMTLDVSSELVVVPATVNDAEHDAANDAAVKEALEDIEKRIRASSLENKAVYPDEVEPVQFSDDF
jgi:hypothetical protein